MSVSPIKNYSALRTGKFDTPKLICYIEAIAIPTIKVLHWFTLDNPEPSEEQIGISIMVIKTRESVGY